MVSLGYCPTCHAKGVKREKRPNGNDICANGHSYPSRNAIPEEEIIKVEGDDRIKLIEAHIDHCTKIIDGIKNYLEHGAYEKGVISDTVEISTWSLPVVLGRTLTFETGQQIIDVIDAHVAQYRKELAKISNTVEPLKVGDKVKVKSEMVGLRHMVGKAYKIQSITDAGNFIIDSTLVHRDEVEPA